MQVQRTPRGGRLAVRSDGLRPIFDDFVADYKFHGTKRHGKPYVSYMVLADMVRAGWRLAAEPTPETTSTGE